MQNSISLTNSSHEAQVRKKGTGLLQLVSFHLGGEEYAVDILKVHEINRMTEITKVPSSLPYVEGVINLRGQVITVINLRDKFGLEHKDNNEHSRIIIMDIRENTIGLVVDSVSEVLRIPESIVEPTPHMAMDKKGTDFITGIAKQEERLIILLNVDRLFGMGETALIAAPKN